MDANEYKSLREGFKKALIEDDWSADKFLAMLDKLAAPLIGKKDNVKLTLYSMKRQYLGQMGAIFHFLPRSGEYIRQGSQIYIVKRVEHSDGSQPEIIAEAIC